MLPMIINMPKFTAAKQKSTKKVSCIMAEIAAVNEAVKYCNNSLNNKEVHTISDCLSALTSIV